MYTQIVVGTNGSPGAGIAVDAAIEVACPTRATLHIVHAHNLTTVHHFAASMAVGVLRNEVVPNVVVPNEAILAESRHICDASVTA